MNTLKCLISSIAFIAITSAAFAQDYSNIEFIENKGQWEPQIKFRGDVNGGVVFITSTGVTFLRHDLKDYNTVHDAVHNSGNKSWSSNVQAGKTVIRSHAYNVSFVGASSSMKLVPDKPLSTYNNYFTGDDPKKWGAECRIYQAVTMKDVYPNVDVRYYTYNGTLKYDIIAKPGADITKIALKYDGVNKLQVKNKELVISTSVGELRESYPYTYQATPKQRKEINSKYLVTGNVVRFDIRDYDRSSTLVIDPSLIFCSFANSTATNWGYTATYGPDGSFFGGGIVFSNGSWPVTVGAFQSTYQGGTGQFPVDIGIIKLSPNGSQRLYATYVGGKDNEQPHSLIVDQAGNCYIAGRTNSPISGDGAYPITAGGKIGTCGGLDIVVTILNPTGTGLISSKRIGGTGNDGLNIKENRGGTQSLEQNYGDDGRSEVMLDDAGNVYVASSTQSMTNTANDKFPTTAGVFQPNPGGGTQDGVVLKFSRNLATLLFASYLGGSANDAGYVVSIGSGGDIYVGGGTESSDFGGTTTAGTVNPTFRGAVDGYVARISSNGSTLIKSTFIGTDKIDQVYGLKFDRSGFPYVTGQTQGNWPIVNAAYSNPGSKQFICKLQPDLSAYVYSTAFGNGSALPNISPTAFLVDRCENVYVSGWGGVSDPTKPSEYATSGTSGLPITPDALPITPDGKDFYFFVLKKDAVSQLYGSYFGQNGGYVDHVDGGTSRFDQNGVIYQGVCANCGGGASFPVTPGVWGPVRPASAVCNLGMIKISFNLAGVGADVQSAIGGVVNDTAGCVPLDVTFTDVVRNATQYIWNFGDGTGDFGPMSADTGYTRVHTFMNVGTYQVMLIAIDPATCNVRDTSYINIRVGDLRANLDAQINKLPPCEAFRYEFRNLSTTNPIRPFTDTSFTWDFGDGSPRVVAGLNSVQHTYPSPGSYNVRLVLNDSAYCNNPDSLTIQLNVAANVVASFDTPPSGCAPYDASFTYTGSGGATWEWDFGDPASGGNNTSTLSNPTHFYAVPGSYTIRMIVRDPNTCNLADTATTTIIVYDKPTAAFSYTPTTPVINTPHVFSNQSSDNSVRFKWLWGDGDSLLTTSRSNVQHQYNTTGTFNACLIAYNQLGCEDTVCMPVEAIVNPLLDVPNAFTPNSNDINSVVRVRGFGIVKIRFIIWNRWGQKVFETANRNEGWNGRVNGVVQPMDVYAYTLEAEFFDGTKATKKGDITLIR